LVVMRIPLRTWALAVIAAVMASALVALWSPSGMDYLAPSCVTSVCDDPGASIDALSHGDLDGFFANQPPMGSFSMLLRTPPAIVSNATGGDDLGVYRSGVFICVLAAALLGVFLAMTMLRRGRPWTLWALVGGACVINPLTYQAVYWGHPEELLAAALAVGAVIAAGRRHWLAGGLMLGAALATKQWAALAVIPALIAAPPGTRVRVALTCIALAAALTFPMLAADPDRFHAAQERVSTAADAYENTVTATNLWWPFSSGSTGEVLDGFGKPKIVTQYSLPGSTGRILHLGVIGVALVLSLLYTRERRRGDPDDVLQLVALLFLARCMLDPLTFSYHHAPFLLALIAFEGLRRSVPLLSAVTIGLLLFMNEVIVPSGEPWLINLFYLGWALPLAGVMAVSLFAPDSRLAVRMRIPRDATDRRGESGARAPHLRALEPGRAGAAGRADLAG
jgi:glycosyl transferase family 87